MSISQELEDLQKQIQLAQAKKARAEVEREHANELLEEARGTLKSEFNIDTLEDAEALKAKLSAALDAAIQKAREALDESSK